MKNKLILIAMIAIGTVVNVFLVSSTMAADDPWTVARFIKPTSHQVVDYQWLKGTGATHYYRVEVPANAVLNLQIDIPTSSARNFLPQAAWFMPSSDTIGPALPLIQPENTIGLIYPGSQKNSIFDIFTQTKKNNILNTQLRVDQPGVYFLAIYNFGIGNGRYRLQLGHDTKLVELADAWQLPIQWWREQAFAGFSWLSLITPLLIGLLAWGVWSRLDHHQLHPHKSYNRKIEKK